MVTESGLEERIKAVVRGVFERTVAGWQGETGRPTRGGGMYGEKGHGVGPGQRYDQGVPRVKVDVQVRGTSKGTAIEVHTLMVGNDGSWHKIWYWNDMGTNPYFRQADQGRSKPFLQYSVRTKTGTLNPGAKGGYSRPSAYIPEGYTRRGIEASGWTVLATAELVQQLNALIRAGTLQNYNYDFAVHPPYTR